MTTHKRENFSGLSPWVLDNEVSTLGVVSEMIDDERSTSIFGRERGEIFKQMVYHPVFFWDQLRWVVLQVLGFSDELG